MKKKKSVKLFSLQRYYTFYEQKFSNLTPLLTITFPQGFQKKNVGYWTSENGGKKIVNWSEKV